MGVADDDEVIKSVQDEATAAAERGEFYGRQVELSDGSVYGEMVLFGPRGGAVKPEWVAMLSLDDMNG